MTKEDRGHYSKKHSPDRKADPALADAVKKRSSEGKLACAVAFEIAKEFSASPEEVGFTMDSLEMPIVKCQLGLFGYGERKKVVAPAEMIQPELKEAILRGSENNRLSCAASWEIAGRLGLRKMSVSSACETLNIKITPCQLGAF